MASPLIHVPTPVIKPEDINDDTIRYLSKDNFALWALHKSIEVDNRKLSFERHKYLLPIYMDSSTEIVLVKAAQLGATVYQLLRLIWFLEQHQGTKAALYLPNKELADNISKDRLTRMFESCPEIYALTDPSDKLGLRKIGKSSLYMMYLEGKSSKDSVPLDYLSFDEVRLSSPASIDQTMERIAASDYKYRVFMSTCFAGDQQIIVRKKEVGAYAEAKSFLDLEYCWQDYDALTYTGGNSVVFAPISKFFSNGERPTLNASFDDNSTVRCTPDHLFAVLNPTGNETFYTPISNAGRVPLRILSDLPVFKDPHVSQSAEFKPGRLYSVRTVGATKVYDIRVDGTHNYILSNGCVVHNCGLPNDSIHSRFLRGKQYVWMSKCKCSDGVDLARTFPNCVVDDPKRGLYLRCPKCLYTIKDAQNGRYVAMNPGADYNSYSVSQLASKFISLKEIWEFYKSTTNIAEFYNGKLGLPWVDEENRGVTMDQMNACVDSEQNWGPHKYGDCAMGVDQGPGYVMAIIANILPNGKKCIRHIEVIEQSNPRYYVNGEKVTPFIRLRELMKEYDVRLCVVDAQPNFNDALSFAQDFKSRVFLAWYQRDAKHAVQWGDKKRSQETIRKAGGLKFRYTVTLARYLSLEAMLGSWSDGRYVLPDPRGLVQICRDESTSQLMPEAVCYRMFNHMCALVRQFTVSNEETGEGRYEWIHTGADHLAHSMNYLNVALERMNKRTLFTFA
jgi:hypothetical protein